MTNETLTTTCSIDGCEAPGTVHANHEGADLYCEDHGICAGCGESIEYFVHVADMDRWLCPCVASRRHISDAPREIYVPQEVVEMPKKSTVQGYWGKTA